MTPATSRRNPSLDASKQDEGELNAGATADTYVPVSAETPVSPETVEACKHGDPNAQRRLYEDSHRSVYRLMVRMVGIQDAADVTQQVFLKAFHKIGLFTGQSQFGTWIYRVAVNEALQHLRKSKRTQVQELKQEPMDLSSGSHENVADKEILEQALAQLNPELRSAFLLREIEGLSYSEIAAALEIPEGTVGSRMNRARRELKQHLTELGWEP